ncbi:MAG TPA: type II toxin-antitoxin system RelE/ParE family toxin [Saprospiraceae bacterium]|nr:type II toxin-antitoxin system RelE/ParE family toxin [Saprospiraceae bacterium]
MLYSIVWSAWAEIQLDNIYYYYLEEAGINIASQLIEDLILSPENLCKNPYICQDEQLLSHRNINYKYLIHKNYKIIFAIDELTKTIKITDVFDTRQNPIKIKRNR